RSISYRDQSITVPGIASVLSRVVGGVQTQITDSESVQTSPVNGLPAEAAKPRGKTASVHGGATVEAEPG
ncbi:hypothetical protein CGI28_26425, partial [Vibrio parahaemolyticus]